MKKLSITLNTSEGKLVKEFVQNVDTFTIGTAASCHLQILDAEAASIELVIKLDGPNYWLFASRESKGFIFENNLQRKIVLNKLSHIYFLNYELIVQLDDAQSGKQMDSLRDQDGSDESTRIVNSADEATRVVSQPKSAQAVGLQLDAPTQIVHSNDESTRIVSVADESTRIVTTAARTAVPASHLDEATRIVLSEKEKMQVQENVQRFSEMRITTDKTEGFHQSEYAVKNPEVAKILGRIQIEEAPIIEKMETPLKINMSFLSAFPREYIVGAVLIAVAVVLILFSMTGKNNNSPEVVINPSAIVPAQQPQAVPASVNAPAVVDVQQKSQVQVQSSEVVFDRVPSSCSKDEYLKSMSQLFGED